MNEALYLRRESPPSRPQQHRAVLIDAGIRSWGVPRIFATAAALAFAATLSNRGSISYFRAKGKEHKAVELLTRPGIVDHLATLEADLHLGEAISAFFDSLADNAASIEPILLMTEDGLTDLAVQTALRRAAVPQLFLATVNRDGRFRMYQRHPHGTKLLHEATLDLGELLTGGSKLTDPARSNDLPAIFFTHPFPLHLAPMIHPERTWYVEPWGVLSVTTDRRLMLWTDKRRGAMQITDRLPPGKPWWSSTIDDDDCISIVLGSSEKLQLVRVNRHGRRFSCLPLQSDPVHDVCSHRGILFGIGKRSISVISMQSGELMERVHPPAGALWHRERFFKTCKSVWYGLSHDGQAARFDEITPTVDQDGMHVVTALFDHPERDGPIGVTGEGRLTSTTNSQTVPIPHGLKGELRMAWASRDGRRLQLTPVVADDRHHRVLVDVDTLTVTRCGPIGYDDRVQRVIPRVGAPSICRRGRDRAGLPRAQVASRPGAELSNSQWIAVVRRGNERRCVATCSHVRAAGQRLRLQAGHRPLGRRQSMRVGFARPVAPATNESRRAGSDAGVVRRRAEWMVVRWLRLGEDVLYQLGTSHTACFDDGSGSGGRV